MSTKPLQFPTNAVRFETRGLLGGAYVGKAAQLLSTLTHLTWLDAKGTELGFACKGPKPEHCADQHAHTEEKLASRPSCPRCAAKWDRLTETQKSESKVATAKS